MVTGLPPGIEAAWGLRERPSKGPKPGLSLDRVVRAAIDVAVADGFAAVSMNRVAKELGASAMALYRYVASKNELVSLMVDVALGAPPERPAGEESWRAGMERWSWTYIDRLRANIWALSVPVTELPNTPNQMAWFEDGLTSLRGTGLAESEKASVIMLLSGYVRNTVATFHTIAESMRATDKSADEVMAMYADTMRQLIDPERFPSVTAMMEAGVFDQADPDDKEFAFGLDRILDGIEALIRSRT